VKAGDTLPEGTLVRTAEKSSADLVLQCNHSIFQLAPQSELQIKKLKHTDTGLGLVSDTRLVVLRGELIGSQRRLQNSSVLEIATSNGEALIRGSGYLINSDGRLSMLSGVADFNFNLPGEAHWSRATIPAGSSFNPQTATVQAVGSDTMQSLNDKLAAVRKSAELNPAVAFAYVAKPPPAMSPHGNNGVGNGVDPQPPGNPPINDGPGTGPGNPGNQGGPNK